MLKIKKNFAFHEESVQHEYIGFLLMHFYVMFQLEDLPSEIRVFQNIYKNPQDYKNSHLPAMPHDDDFEVFNQFKQTNTESLKFYECSKGHIYSIGECKKPAMTAKCPTCQETIGGAGYKLAEGNKEASHLIEKNLSGYSLQSASQRLDDPENIRNMGSLETSILRIFLNCTLYICSMKQKQSMIDLIKFKTAALDDPREYFYEQLVKELRILSKVIQNSPDESILLVHFLLNKLAFQKTNQANFNLKEQKDRDNFEKLFIETLRNRLQDESSLDKLIKNLTDKIAQDAKHNKNDKVFQIAYELTDFGHSMSIDDELEFLQNKNYWLFRKQINIEVMSNHFANSVEKSAENKKRYKLLRKFISQIRELEAIKYLPDICKMQKLVCHKFNRHIDRHTASQIRIKDFIEIYLQNDDQLKEVVKTGSIAFLNAWKTIKSKLDKVISSSLINKIKLENELLKLANYEDLPLSYVLANKFKTGLYIYVLVFYLINLNNQFIKFYNDLTKNDESSNKVGVNQLTPSDCINFSTEKDILQIVFMHSNYSLERANQVNLEFDFVKIQQTIESRFVSNKLFVDTDTIPIFDYSDDVSDSNRFDHLNEKCVQKELDYNLVERISSTFRQPNELNDIISKINVIIDFVISSGCSKDTKIEDYAVNVLKMHTFNENYKSKEIEELSIVYLKSLWDLLNIRRAILLTEHGQDPFDQLNESFKYQIRADDDFSSDDESKAETSDSQESDEKEREMKINEKLIKKLVNGKIFLNLNNLFRILRLLYKFIVHKLYFLNETNVQEYTELRLESTLQELIEEEQEENEVNKEEKVQLKDFDLRNFQVKNTFHLWKLFTKVYLESRLK